MASIYDCDRKPSKIVYDELNETYNEMMSCFDKASTLTDTGKIDEAIAMYEFAINIIDVALSKPIESPSVPDVEWEKAYAIVTKMRKCRKEALSRISDIQSRVQSNADAAPPPSYEEAMALPLSNSQQPYLPSREFEADGHNLYPDITPQLEEARQGTANHEIIYSHNNVRVYFIAPDGRVSSTMEPDTLIIGRYEDIRGVDILDQTLSMIVDELTLEKENADKEKHKHKHHHGHHHRSKHHRRHRHRQQDSSSERQLQDDQGQLYLSVGTWVYPLISNVSPCYRTEYGAYILPDVHSTIQGAAVGLILPATADASVHEILSSILLGAMSQENTTPTRPARSRRSDHTDKHRESRFSNRVVRGASYVADNLVRGAGSASRFLDSAAPHIMNRITPNPSPQPINPTVKTSMNVAKTVSNTAVTVSDFLANKLGSAATSLGQYLSPHIQRQGTKLLSSTTKMSPEEASKKISTLLDATAGAIQGVATVYTGLESAASILGSSLANNTVQIIKHKYGHEAGNVTNDAFSTAGNLYTVHGNYKVLKPTGIAKTIAKGAIKESEVTAVENNVDQSVPQEENFSNGLQSSTTLSPPNNNNNQSLYPRLSRDSIDPKVHFQDKNPEKQ